MKLKVPSSVKFRYGSIGELVSSLFVLLDSIIVFSLSLSILTSFRDVTQMKIWISFTFILFVIRIIRSVFQGIGVFGPVGFDISLLVMITGFLLMTIYHGGNYGYSDLGGSNIWGVGTIMLFGLSLYMLTISFSSKLTKVASILGVSLGIFIYHIRVFQDAGSSIGISSSRFDIFPAITLTDGILGLTGFMVSVYGLLVIKSKYKKFFVLILGILSAIVFSSGFKWALAIHLWAVLLIFCKYLILKNYFISKSKNISKVRLIFSRPVLLTGGLFGLFTLTGVIIYFVNESFRNTLVYITDSYKKIPDLTSGLEDIFLGQGLLVYLNDLGALFLSYGIIGIVLICLIIVTILWRFRGEFKYLEEKVLRKNPSDYKLSIARLYLYFLYLASLFVAISIGRVSVILVFLACLAIALLFTEKSEQTRRKKEDEGKESAFYNMISKSDILKRPGVKESLLGLRFLFIVVLLFFTPNIIELIFEIFGV